MKYLVFQQECCPTTGRLHWQGFVIMAKSVRYTGVQKAIGDAKAHMEIAADPKKAADYCKATTWDGKDKGQIPNTMEEYGTFSAGQGNRSDLKALEENLKAGATDKELWDTNFGSMLKYNRGVAAYRAITEGGRPRGQAPRVYVLTGPPGTGKSLYAAQRFREDDTFFLSRPSNSMDPWWDGYTGQSVVVLDDFYGWIRYSYLLNLLDRYPVRINIKGQPQQLLRATTFVITSNKLPDLWYKDELDISALRRRLYEFAFELRYNVDTRAFDLYDRPADDPNWTRVAGSYVEPPIRDQPGGVSYESDASVDLGDI